MRYGSSYGVGRCRQTFCIDKYSPESYYKSQVGGYIPPYVGVRYQRGRGLGSSILSGLSRVAVPLLKKGVTTLGKQALATGTQLAGDIMSGKNVKKAIKRRAKEGGVGLIKRFLAGQKGSGKSLQTLFGTRLPPKRRRRRRQKLKRKKKKRKQKGPPPGRRADIFDY